MEKSGVLGIGVATMDIYVDRKRMYPGGNEYNVACNAAFQGTRAGFLGVFADDKAGEILERTLIEKGIQTTYSHHEHGSSGYSLVELKEDGDRVFLDWNRQGVTDLYPIQFTEEELAYVQTYEVVSLGRCASVSLDRIAYLASKGVEICYDFHAAFTEEDIDTYAPYTSYAFFSCSHLKEDEIKATLKRATDHGCKIAVGTRGSASVYAFDGASYYEQPVCKVEPKDALGAGDSYIGAFLANYLRLAKLENVEQDDMTEQNSKTEQTDAVKPNNFLQQALALAAKHAAGVVMIEGSIGVGYDVEVDEIGSLIHGFSFP